jgi:hypothetical protein
MNNKRVTSLILSFTMILSFVTPVFASEDTYNVEDDTSNITETNFESNTSESITETLAPISESDEEDTSETTTSSQSTINYEGDTNQYFITVPTSLSLDGEVGTVYVEGVIEEGYGLIVSADPTITVTNTTSGDSKTININFDGITIEGQDSYESTSADISADFFNDIIFGYWEGTLNYSVRIGEFAEYTISNDIGANSNKGTKEKYKFFAGATIGELFKDYADANGYTLKYGYTYTDIETGKDCRFLYVNPGYSTTNYMVGVYGSRSLYRYNDVWDSDIADTSTVYNIACTNSASYWSFYNTRVYRSVVYSKITSYDYPGYFGFGDFNVCFGNDMTWGELAEWFNENGTGKYTYIVNDDYILRTDQEGYTWKLYNGYSSGSIISPSSSAYTVENGTVYNKCYWIPCTE